MAGSPAKLPGSEKSAGAAALAALASVVAMLGCCLPLPALLAAGSLGAAASLIDAWLPAARPYLLTAAIACLGFAFYRLYHRRYCRARRPLWLQALVWTALFAVAATTFFPQWTANLLAGPVPAASTAANTTAAGARGPQQPLLTLRDLTALRDRFNAASAHPRLIALLSPT